MKAISWFLSLAVVTCPVPSPEPVGTTVSCSYSGISTAASLRQNYSASCTYECGNGYSMTEGTSQRVCLASGDWNGIPVICEGAFTQWTSKMQWTFTSTIKSN